MHNNTMIREAAFSQMPSGKRLIDLFCVLLAMPVLLLFTFLTAIIMRFLSPGPVFFLQERVGYMGRRFKIYKFRTMHVAADTKSHQQHVRALIGSNAPMTKLDARGDTRMIPGGWLMRASGLDELPQLINVFLGDMSLVGPRPCLPWEYEEYTQAQRKRFHATPGLTGLWQVSGKNRTTFDEMIRLDIKYAENKSLAMDLYIICMTIPALLQQISDTRKGRKQIKDDGRMTEIPFPTTESMQEKNNNLKAR